VSCISHGRLQNACLPATMSGFAASHPLPGSGKVSSASVQVLRPARWPVQPPALPSSPTLRRSPVAALPARTAGNLRDGLVRDASALPADGALPSARSRKGPTSGRGSVSRRFRVPVLHRRRFPSWFSCLISSSPGRWNPCSLATSARVLRKGCAWARVDRLFLRSRLDRLHVRFLIDPGHVSIVPLGCILGWSSLAA
jgi:hypothetical protein